MYILLVRLAWWLLLTTACTLALQRQAWAQLPVAEHDLKAAYIFNFIQFVEWPADIPGETKEWSLCVSAFSPLLRSLSALEGRPLPNGQNIRTRFIDPSDVRECRMLVLQQADMERLSKLPHPVLGSLGILTLSDDPLAIRTGVMISLSEQGGRIVFDINTTAARKAGLKISSRLLRLARTVQ